MTVDEFKQLKHDDLVIIAECRDRFDTQLHNCILRCTKSKHRIDSIIIPFEVIHFAKGKPKNWASNTVWMTKNDGCCIKKIAIDGHELLLI